MAATNSPVHLSLKGCQSNVAAFFDRQDLSDCSIVTPESEECCCTLLCHKLALCSASPVFKAMFTSDVMESASNRVTIQNAEPSVVEMLVRHMYGLYVSVPLQQVPDLYKLADQYQVSTATDGLQVATKKARFSLEALQELLPRVALLGDAATPLRFILANHAAKHIAAIMDHIGSVKHWGLMELQTLMAHGEVSAFQALQLAAAWAEGDSGRKHSWGKVNREVHLAKLTFAQLKELEWKPAVLSLPGAASALYSECLRRMNKCITFEGCRVSKGMFD